MFSFVFTGIWEWKLSPNPGSWLASLAEDHEVFMKTGVGYIRRREYEKPHSILVFTNFKLHSVDLTDTLCSKLTWAYADIVIKAQKSWNKMTELHNASLSVWLQR